MIKKIEQSLAFLQEKGMGPASIGIVLGTGMYELIPQLTLEKSIAYTDIPHFPEATQEYQKGMLHYGSLGGGKSACFSGAISFV
jgi:purine-nucleoside phosphorylase